MQLNYLGLESEAQRDADSVLITIQCRTVSFQPVHYITFIDLINESHYRRILSQISLFVVRRFAEDSPSHLNRKLPALTYLVLSVNERITKPSAKFLHTSNIVICILSKRIKGKTKFIYKWSGKVSFIWYIILTTQK